MRKLWWKLRYALVMWWALDGSMALRFCWDCAEAGWDASQEISMTPTEAVYEELSCWSN